MPSLSPHSHSSAKKRSRTRQAFWYNTLSGCLILFVLASGIGGSFIGGVMGLTSWMEMAWGRPWWYWVGNTATANALWMMVLGLFSGALLFAIVALSSWRWRRGRKWRFARSLKTGFYIPLTASIVAVPLVISVVGAAVSNPATFDWGTYLMNSEILTLALAPLLLMGRLMYLSKAPHSHRPTAPERLLPLD